MAVVVHSECSTLFAAAEWILLQLVLLYYDIIHTLYVVVRGSIKGCQFNVIPQISPNFKDAKCL